MLFLKFDIGDRHFAIKASEVVEVVSMVRLEEAPGAPESVAGMMLYHGEAAAVVDLCRLVTGVAAKRLLSTRIMVVRCPAGARGDHLVGLVAEAMTETVNIDPEELSDAEVSFKGAGTTGRIYYEGDDMVHVVGARALLPPDLREMIFGAAAEGA